MRFRNTLAGTWKQFFLWGRYNVLLYKKYRPYGMPLLDWKKGLKIWVGLLRQLPRLRTRTRLERWLRAVVWRLGRIDGCLRYKVLAL
jgi:hypothetical protein